MRKSPASIVSIWQLPFGCSDLNHITCTSPKLRLAPKSSQLSKFHHTPSLAAQRRRRIWLLGIDKSTVHSSRTLATKRQAPPQNRSIISVGPQSAPEPYILSKIAAISKEAISRHWDELNRRLNRAKLGRPAPQACRNADHPKYLGSPLGRAMPTGTAKIFH